MTSKKKHAKPRLWREILPTSDIDRINFGGAPRQQHISKAAGRRTDIERDEALDTDGEMLECVSEFDTAARYPGMIAAAHLDHGGFGDRLAGFIDPPLALKDDSGED